ncbi:uncharacterized protein LOC135496236 isoform X2 [Lineus longissimus]|uniref:uncharacterized protein LOC135496236 isoform X2 n=1 Tax=Lineus longissimus TaxID=88925 RepID=UPI00315CC4AB
MSSYCCRMYRVAVLVLIVACIKAQVIYHEERDEEGSGKDAKNECEEEGGQCKRAKTCIRDTRGKIDIELSQECPGRSVCCVKKAPEKSKCEKKGGECKGAMRCQFHDDARINYGLSEDCPGVKVCCVPRKNACEREYGHCRGARSCVRGAKGQAASGLSLDCPGNTVCCVNMRLG